MDSLHYRFFIYNHQDKGVPFASILEHRGWDRVGSPNEAHIILADLESFGRERYLSLYFERNHTPTVLYPHGGVASYCWNFPGSQHFNFVAAVMVSSYGPTHIMRSYGCAYKTIEVGWPYGDVSQRAPNGPFVEFHPILGGGPCSVLFGPIHPNRNGFLPNIDREVNAHAFQALLSLKRSGAISTLTVRHIKGLKQNGIWHDPGSIYQEVVPSIEDSIKAVREYDLVVSHGSLLAMAVSQGTPAIGMGEWIAPHYGGSIEALTYVMDWSKYKDIMAFPLDIISESDKAFLLQRATYSDYEIAEWRSSMIGGPLDGERISSELEKIVNEYRPFSETNRRIGTANGEEGEISTAKIGEAKSA